MTPLNRPVSLSKPHQNHSTSTLQDLGKYQGCLKSPPICCLCHHFAPCLCRPQLTYMGMKGFHGFHFQIGFNLLKQIFSQGEKNPFFSNWIFQLVQSIGISSHFLKIGWCKAQLRQLSYLGHCLAYTQMNTDTFEVCRYAKFMLILWRLPADWNQM